MFIELLLNLIYLKYLKIYKPEKYAEECKRLGIVEPVYPMKVNKNKS